MIQSKQDYLYAIQKTIGKHPEAGEILNELELHLNELLSHFVLSEGLNEKEAMKKIIEQVGPPQQLAALYEQELRVTPSKTTWTFIAVNLFFFVAGVLLTVAYHIYPDSFVPRIWSFLTSIQSLLIILYMFFWAVLGYEIGKEFGISGKPLLRRTFYFSLVPNLTLMALVLFKIVPHYWFAPLLTPTFIGVCILCTILLFPISIAGFKWGISRSI
jgi:hypothetical protein